MGFLSNKISRDKLKRGDHIYSWLAWKTFAHHGIYLGNGKVIHYIRRTGNSSGKSIGVSSSYYRSTRGGVISSSLDCFLNGGDLNVCKYNVSSARFLVKRGGTCTLESSDPPEEVIYRAIFLLQNNGSGDYNLFKHNCEDFALYCKTGMVLPEGFMRGRSGQIVSLAATAQVVPAGVASTAVHIVIAVGGHVLGAAPPFFVFYTGGIFLFGSAVCFLYPLGRYNDMRRNLINMPVERLVAERLVADMLHS